MKNFLREAADWSSEALETACGWALYVAIGYAVFFVDMTGRGNLWSHLQSMAKEGKTAPAVASHDGVRVIKLGAPEEKRDDGVQMVEYDYLSKPDTQEKALVAVNDERRVSDLTDSPADPAASGDWKRSLKGELRSFQVYGHGSETTSASASVQAAPAKPAAGAASPGVVVAASVPQSAHRQGEGAASRPAIASRARALSQNGSDDVRNFAGKR
ncbi:MAG: hypothetical protein SF051_16975 [Elusimicrobiota bacterium]|nr:hypothetical protein [Elusimicrobiota bacterium]